VLLLKKTVGEIIAVFWVGAIAYGCVEVIERGYSHITMALLGGISLIMIHLLNDERRCGAHCILLLLISTAFITASELLAGEILNVYLKMDIWNYGNMAYNLDGVICPSYTFCWFLLSFAGMFVDDLIRVRLFREKADFDYLRLKRFLSVRT